MYIFFGEMSQILWPIPYVWCWEPNSGPWLFEIGSCYVVQDCLELVIFLYLPPECWDCRCVSPAWLFCTFFNWVVFFFLLQSYESSSYTLDASLWSDVQFTNILSQSMACTFICIDVCWSRKMFNFVRINIIHFSLFVQGVVCKNSTWSKITECFTCIFF
jgi:hypothetical protein